jgi:DNA primase
MNSAKTTPSSISDSIAAARSIDVLDFIEKYYGFTFTQKSPTQYRCKEHHSLTVNADRQSWYWHSKGTGGHGAIDFLTKAEQMDFKTAIKTLDEMIPRISSHTRNESNIIKADFKNPLILPEKADFLYKRLYAYLVNTRGIDPNIVKEMLHEKRMYEDKKGNIVFIGYDENNAPKFASLRGTYTNKPFKMDCQGSDKSFSFRMEGTRTDGTTPKQLYVFESPIDCLSHATLKKLHDGDNSPWQEDIRLSLGGTADTALEKYLERNKDIKEIILCLDNDQPGHEAAIRISQKYNARGYKVRTEFPESKDHNEDLKKHINKHKANSVSASKKHVECL